MHHGTLTKKQLARSNKLQKEMLKRAHEQKEPKKITILGQPLILYPKVFRPFRDTDLLLRSVSINPGDIVLDVGTGTGALAIFAAKAGAKKVIALDINPAAVANTRANIKLHKLEKNLQVKRSDMFASLKQYEKFNVVIANLPFVDRSARNFLEHSLWDHKLAATSKFFRGINKHILPGAKVYFAQSNIGPLDRVRGLAKQHGFLLRLISETKSTVKDPRKFFVFRLIPHH